MSQITRASSSSLPVKKSEELRLVELEMLNSASATMAMATAIIESGEKKNKKVDKKLNSDQVTNLFLAYLGESEAARGVFVAAKAVKDALEAKNSENKPDVFDLFGRLKGAMAALEDAKKVSKTREDEFDEILPEDASI